MSSLKWPSIIPNNVSPPHGNRALLKDRGGELSLNKAIFIGGAGIGVGTLRFPSSISPLGLLIISWHSQAGSWRSTYPTSVGVPLVASRWQLASAPSARCAKDVLLPGLTVHHVFWPTKKRLFSDVSAWPPKIAQNILHFIYMSIYFSILSKWNKSC